MASRNESLYEVLGVSREASVADIDRAYRRIVAELQRETTPPDPRRRVLVGHAHDTLMDPVRREAYDRDRRGPQAAMDRARRSPALMAGIAIAVLATGAGAWALLGKDSRPGAAVPRAEIENAVTRAVGRVQRTELSGTTTPLGLAFAIDAGALVTSCAGLSPDAALGVRYGSRVVPVHVVASDARGLCRLAGADAGSWQLPVAYFDPAAGDAAYVVRLDANGQAMLTEARVRSIQRKGEVRVFDAAPAPAATDLGAPLLDLEGRVVAAASGTARSYVSLPTGWKADSRPAEGPRRR
jgi:DnaJ-like protein/trypsin-like peptidase